METAEYSDPEAASYLSDVIIARRDKIGLAWLTHVNPLVDFALAGDGTLTFRNVAADTRRVAGAGSYAVQWARFDNHSGLATPAGALQQMSPPSTRIPASLLGQPFVEARVSARSSAHPAWAEPLIVRFRRGEAGWALVGLRRGPDPPALEPSR